MDIITFMKVLCGIGFVFTGTLLVLDIRKKLATEEGRALWEKQKKHGVYNLFVSLFSNFFDVLGIGSYATASALYKLRGSVEDENLPGTLNVGDTLPVLIEAFLFLGFVKIDPMTLVPMMISAVVGAYAGASIVTKWDRRKVRYGMGVGLFVLGLIMAARQLGLGPFGMAGTATGLTGGKLIFAVIVNFFLGALMNIGIGMYAPCMALVSLLGMDVTVAFPIMMGSCAYLMSFGNSPKFIKESRYDMVATLLRATFGSVAVLFAFFFIKSLPLTVLFWIIVCVVFFTASMFLRDAITNKQ